MFDALGNIGDFIGGVGVVVSLVYLALQIRQNTMTTRVAAVQHILTNDTAAADSVISGPIPEILGKLEVGERLSQAEIAAYTLYMRGRLTEAWQVFYQQQNGLIEPEVAAALLSRLGVSIRSKLFRSVWRGTLEVGFPADFRSHIESAMHAVDEGESAQPRR